MHPTVFSGKVFPLQTLTIESNHFFFGFVMKYFLFYVVGKIFLVPRMIFVDPMGWYYGVTFPANSVAISHFADNIFTTGKYNLILEL